MERDIMINALLQMLEDDMNTCKFQYRNDTTIITVSYEYIHDL